MELAHLFSPLAPNVARLSDHELLRTLRSRRRAARALDGVTYSGLSEDTAHELSEKVSTDLYRLERECESRGLSVH